MPHMLHFRRSELRPPAPRAFSHIAQNGCRNASCAPLGGRWPCPCAPGAASPAASYHRPARRPLARRSWRRRRAATGERRAAEGSGAGDGATAGGARRRHGGQGAAHRHRHWRHLYHLRGTFYGWGACLVQSVDCARPAKLQQRTHERSAVAPSSDTAVLQHRCAFRPDLFSLAPAVLLPGHLSGTRILPGHPRRRAAAATT